MKKARLLALIPVYDDWSAAAGLVEQVGRLDLGACEIRVLLIDDGSTRGHPAERFRALKGSAIAGFSVLQLERNLGHQGAIAVGLGHVAAAKEAYDAVLVMDGDGEDAPADILALLGAWEASGRERAVFAQRARRSEGPLFRAFYQLYRLAYRLLTGTWISMGNFSLLPRAYVAKLILYPELWRHYPATVKKSRLAVDLVPTRRAPRLDGESKMNFNNLVLHGLGAILVHSDIVGVRGLVAMAAVMGLGALGLAGLGLALALGIGPLPGWTQALLLALVVTVLQLGSSAAIFAFLTLANRSPVALDPAHNYQGFVKQRVKIF